MTSNSRTDIPVINQAQLLRYIDHRGGRYALMLAMGTILRVHRKRHGLSQDRLNDMCSLDRTYASLLERGLRLPTWPTLMKLAVPLETTAPEMFSHAETLLYLRMMKKDENPFLAELTASPFFMKGEHEHSFRE